MLVPSLHGTIAELSTVLFGFDASRIPSINVSSTIAASDNLKATLLALLLERGMKPQGAFTIESTELVDSPGMGMLCVLEALRCSRDDLMDPDREGAILWGEINLHGLLTASRGTFAVARLARDCGYSTLVIPAQAYDPLLDLIEIDIVLVSDIDHLIELAANWDDRTIVERNPPQIEDRWVGCIAQIEGCELGKFALEVMLAGRHSCLFTSNDPIMKIFPRLLRSIAPLVRDDIEEILSIRSTLSTKLSAVDPFPIRQPHSSASRKAMLGGRVGGEVNIAHRGVLLLDDAGNFPLSIVNDLLHVERHGTSYIYKQGQMITLPAEFTLFALTSECACGLRPCRDSQGSRDRWRDRLRPFHTRCAIQVDPTTRADLDREQTSVAIRSRIERARQINGPHVAERRAAAAAGAYLDPVDDLAHTVAALDGRLHPRDGDRELATLLRSSSPL